MRRPYIAGNWKLWGTRAETGEYCERLLGLLPPAGERPSDVGICGPYTALDLLVEKLAGSDVRVLAQNMHQEEKGAFTGEVSAAMLRARTGSTAWCWATPSAASTSARPTARSRTRCRPRSRRDSGRSLCVGETEEEREQGETERKLRHQVQEDLVNVDDDRLGDVVIAYEPIWAIGTGLTATPEQAQEAVAFVRRAGGRPLARAGRAGAGALRRQRQAGERGRAPGPARRGRRAGGRREPGPGGIRPDRGRRRAIRCGAVTAPDGPAPPPVPSVCLVVLDGFGLAEPGPGNAVELADTPVFDELWERYPHSTLTTWGPLVGLPEGQMGNSEVGHMNLGAGGVVKQEITRIDEAVEGGSFFDNEVLRAACAAGREAGRLHLLGLVSEGGVHASMKHLKACLELAAREDVPDVVLHAFTDGRDTHPDAGAGYVAEVEGWMRELGSGRVGSVSGRYYAMDRDRRWDRIKLAWEAIVHGRAEPPPAESGRVPSAPPTSATRPTSSSSRPSSATRPGSATATPCSSSTSAPTALAS